ncbi:MAG: UDP-N-acetylmuramate--L-alanine ligase [Treponema sp.]|nr:UDP-N-acetylmuramate--L-alanine ligase [Treponema sp.]
MTDVKMTEDLNGVHIHFVGIKGTGMCALVEIFFHKGAIITGSDVSERFYTDERLEKLGIKPQGFSENNITDDIQYVVYSSAYKLDVNPDLIAAVKKNIPCLLYTEALGLYSSFAYSCGVSGVHGKTSTSGITGTILKELPLPSQTLSGSVIKSFGDACTYTSPLMNQNEEKKAGEKSIFVAETCEYQRHFMKFHPEKIILTSVEPDHQDYYPTYEDIRDAFVDYACLMPSGGDLIYCADDKGACEVSKIVSEKRSDINMIPYGTMADGVYKLSFLGVTKGPSGEENKFNISGLGDFALKVPGKHEVLDACAAVVLCARLLEKYGKNPSDFINEIRTGLLNFAGGKRRSEIVGEFKNKNGRSVVVIDDYGHHPTAVKTTLAGFKEFYKGRKLIVDFMSHTYSRTQALLTEFAGSFEVADKVILHKIYSSARENPKDFSITGRTLFEETRKNKPDTDSVVYFEEILDALDYAEKEVNAPLDSKYPDGYLFVTMGAGDNWKLGKALLEKN